MKTGISSLLLAVNPIKMAVSMPTQIQQTINNITVAGQIAGGALASIFLVVAAVQHMQGSEESIQKSKKKIVAIIVGIALCAGCTVIKGWISSLMAF
ncbi:hypothetical protein [Thermocaproicibacter melissae]|uniref:hypothetical protein n=1 Tax=Thermocaproicibacter melissae TaxID=2966552 RepID=UPI0024B08246|nr:hypothetical protein [Thermocaproicibacter melissae]WBY64699.1 hypothetical protein NOG13_03105 [Thermocaproicibacter melissae]